MQSALNSWAAQQSSADENRSEAVNRILAAFNTGSLMLSLDNLGLQSLPERIGNLTRLSELSLSKNQLTQLPLGFFRLPDATNIRIENNSLVQELDALRQVAQALNAWAAQNSPEDEHRSEAAQKIFEAFCTNSAILDLSNLGLRSLPDQISDLSQLTELNLFGNSLDLLPESIGDLAQLTKLNLSKNQMTPITPTLSGFF